MNLVNVNEVASLKDEIARLKAEVVRLTAEIEVLEGAGPLKVLSTSIYTVSSWMHPLQDHVAVECWWRFNLPPGHSEH